MWLKYGVALLVHHVLQALLDVFEFASCLRDAAAPSAAATEPAASRALQARYPSGLRTDAGCYKCCGIAFEGSFDCSVAVAGRSTSSLSSWTCLPCLPGLFPA